MTEIQKIFQGGWQEYCRHFNPSDEQSQAAFSIMNCKTGKFGYNISRCEKCDYLDFHANSCRNRNCPNCQAVLKELRVDKRRSEMIDAGCFHAVFTIPAQLNPLVYANRKLLYGLLHRCCAETKDLKLCKANFFIRIEPLIHMFRGKFLHYLEQYYRGSLLLLPKSCIHLKNRYSRAAFRNSLYHIHWNVEIRETFNGHGNALEYLGRYANRIAITNARIRKVTDSEVAFSAKDYRNGSMKNITISCMEFIRRFMMHVLPSGFQKIRYYGFLNNRWKKQNLMTIFRIRGHRKYQEMLSGLSMEQVLLTVWNHNIRSCPKCGCNSMHHAGKTFAMLC